MIIFYANFIDKDNILLEEDEFVHCIKVLRNKVGDVVQITNGQGIFGSAQITNIKGKTAQLELLNSEQLPHRPFNISLAVAPPKSKNRWELILEKCVEIGVDKILPFTSSNSERQKLNIERAEKIMRSASLQSKRSHHPIIQEPLKFVDIIKNAPKHTHNFIAHYIAQQNTLTDFHPSLASALIIIGPEGDFAPEELELAKTHNFECVNLSNNRLRTETAAIVATTLINAQYENQFIPR